MQRTLRWWEDRAAQGRRELQQLFDESATSRTPAGRLYPNLGRAGSWRSVEIARRPAQPTQKSIASRLYPTLPTENK
jgi:hypothetical protein